MKKRVREKNCSGNEKKRTKDGVVASKSRDEERILHKHNHTILPQLYQTQVLFKSHNQMGQQGIDKVQQKYCICLVSLE